MIIKVRDGNTTRGLRPFTDQGALAHFLDGMKIGDHKTIAGFEGANGAEVALAKVQIKLGHAKPDGYVYRSRTTPEGLTVWRLA